jgi:hypothetical protein
MTFIQDNQITRLNIDPTECFQKKIQQALQKCNTLIEESKYKYLMNIKPAAPYLNAYVKTHRQDKPIRPVVNNIRTPAYKLAKLLNKILQSLTKLPNTYITKTSHEVAQELHNIQTDRNCRLITLDIKTYMSIYLSKISSGPPNFG